MKQVQNQFYGKVADIPHILPVGSIYVCTDTNQTFAAGRDQIPVEISGIDDATKLELAEVLAFSRENTQGHYALLSGVYFGGTSTTFSIPVEGVDTWTDIILSVDPAGTFDFRPDEMKDAQAVGHLGTGASGDPICFKLEGLTQNGHCSLRAVMRFDPDEDSGRLDNRLLFKRHSGTTPSEDFSIEESAISMESGANELYANTPNIQFFIGDTIDTNGPGDAGTVQFQVKSDVAGTVYVDEIALFIQS